MSAQATLGAAAVAGIVRDEHGLPVADAKITLTDNSKATSRESSSNSSGEFRFPSIGAGSDMLRIAKTGFSTYVVNNLGVEVGERAALDLTVQVGEVRTVIGVSAGAAALLDTESNAVGTVIDSARVSDLPLNGRNFLQLGLLVGGAVEDSPVSTVFSANIGSPGRTILLQATMPYSVGYVIDGVPVRGSRDGELALNVSLAAIDQFKIEENFLMPDQGPDAAIVNVATKSGGNQFHGEAFEFLRNGAFDARSLFAPGAEDLKQNQFGIAVGGPIKLASSSTAMRRDYR